eukprot:3936971-Rhodomonas_salina.1
MTCGCPVEDVPETCASDLPMLRGQPFCTPDSFQQCTSSQTCHKLPSNALLHKLVTICPLLLWHHQP